MITKSIFALVAAWATTSACAPASVVLAPGHPARVTAPGGAGIEPSTILAPGVAGKVLDDPYHAPPGEDAPTPTPPAPGPAPGAADPHAGHGGAR